MKNLFVALVLVVSVAGFSASLNDVLQTALASSTDYQIAQIDLETATMDYEKAKLEATNRKSELSAELSYYNNLQKYRSSLKSVYQDVLGRIFDLLIAEVSYESAQINFENAQEDHRTNQELFKKNLISENDLKDSELTLEEASNSLLSAKYDLDKAKKNYEELFSVEASEIELPLVDFHGLVSEEEYLDNVLSVKIAEINMKIAEYDLNNLSAAASKHERRTAELAYQKAKMNYEKTLKEAKDTYRSTINSLEVM
ncbi:MAG: hypothetical protein PWQ26_574, partial [Thermotoga sp.]|nr:hypothetical protein [Thermotoga sp.]